LTDKLLNRFKTRIKGFTLIPSSGGCFELTVDGDLVYSKLQTKQFPDEAEMLEQLASRTSK
jgi:selenoprotein W-related protein